MQHPGFYDRAGPFTLAAIAERIGAELPSGVDGSRRIEDDASIRVSAGTSLLWNSPLGPLRADFGFAIMKENYDKEQLFRFGASTKF